jgi:phospholipase/carboxylesterase
VSHRYESNSADESVVGLKFLYRPGVEPTAPLVVLVHGRAGNRGVMWTFERVIPEHCHVVSFEAFLPDPLGGWSWWDMTAEGSKRDAIGLAAHKLQQSMRAFLDLRGLKPCRSVALGFSQGSGVITAATFLGLGSFDAVAVLAGFVFLPEVVPDHAKSIPVFIAHGTLDETVSIEKARRAAKALQELGNPLLFVEEEVGHKVGIQGTRALKKWLIEQLGSHD